MNTQRAREDILANLDNLPEKFGETAFYNPKTGCMCFWGWLASVTTGTPPADLQPLTDSEYSKAWDILLERYEFGPATRLLDADRAIQAAGGHPRVVVDAILNSLTNYPE